MRTVCGTDLSPRMQAEAKRLFVYRSTGDNIGGRLPNSSLQFRNDEEWLANTFFSITSHGTFARGRGCFSTPTWPEDTLHRCVVTARPPTATPTYWDAAVMAAQKVVNGRRS